MKKFRFSKRFAKIRQNLSVDLDFNKRRSISLGDFIKILWPILKSLKSVTMYPCNLVRVGIAPISKKLTVNSQKTYFPLFILSIITLLNYSL